VAGDDLATGEVSAGLVVNMAVPGEQHIHLTPGVGLSRVKPPILQEDELGIREIRHFNSADELFLRNYSAVLSPQAFLEG